MCALHQIRAEKSLGPGEERHEDESDNDEHEAGDPLEQELVARERVTDERRRRVEQDEHEREGEDERKARDDDAWRGPWLAQTVRLDRRGRRGARKGPGELLPERQASRRKDR